MNTSHTKMLEVCQRKIDAAKEAGFYNPKYSVYFNIEGVDHRDDEAFEREIENYLCACARI